MSQSPYRPRRTNVRPLALERRLRGYAAGITAANERPIGTRQASPELGVRIDWFTVVEERADDVVCLRRAAPGMTVLLAKPPDLQGAVAVRDFSGDQHQITPPYTAGLKVWGQSLPGGGGQVQADGRPYEWLDQNRDARAWARTPT